MKKIFILLLLVSTIVRAQYKITGELNPPGKSTWVILYKIEGVKRVFIKDSTIKTTSKTVEGKKTPVGKFEFELPIDTKPGSYRVSYKKGFVNLLFNKEDIYFSFNPKKAATKLVFYKSEENKIYRNYLKVNSITQNKIDSLQIEYFNRPSKKIADLYTSKLKKIANLQKYYAKKSTGKLALNLIIASENYNSPIIAKNPQEHLISSINHYFDAIDINDTALYNSSFLIDAITNYVFYINYSENAETQKEMYKKAVRIVLNKVRNITFKRDITEYLITQFIDYNDANFIDYLLATHYDELPEKVQNAKFRKKTLEETAAGIGRIAPEIVWRENGKNYKLSTIDEARNYVLVFWSTECSHCLKQIPKLNAFTQDKKNTKVIAFSLENDKKKWNNYVPKLNGWHHILGLNKWENAISKTYQIYSTPTYIVLDSDKKVIARPRNLKDLEKIIREIEEELRF